MDNPVIYNKEVFISAFQIHIPFISLTSLIALGKISSTILKISIGRTFLALF